MSTGWMGIDAGGSHSRAVLADRQWRILHQVEGPAIQLSELGIEQAAGRLTRLAEQCVEAVNEPHIQGLGVGLAGAGTPELQERLQHALAGHLPRWRIRVSSDALIAHYAAFHGADGILLLAGTGSMVLVRSHGHWQRYGGYGPRIGDPCSGSTFGHLYLQQQLLQFETGSTGPDTTHTQAATLPAPSQATYGTPFTSTEELLQALYHGGRSPADYASYFLALAAERRQPYLDWLDRESDKLLKLCRAACRHADSGLSLICSGGLLQDAFLFDHLKQKWNRMTGDWGAAPAMQCFDGEPALGGCRLIREQMAL